MAGIFRAGQKRGTKIPNAAVIVFAHVAHIAKVYSAFTCPFIKQATNSRYTPHAGRFTKGKTNTDALLIGSIGVGFCVAALRGQGAIFRRSVSGAEAPMQQHQQPGQHQD